MQEWCDQIGVGRLPLAAVLGFERKGGDQGERIAPARSRAPPARTLGVRG